jgi:hypothetical protein
MTSTIYRDEPREQPRAIETIYKGYRFRSRLEARWAVFFDALGLDWTYEPEGFDLDGVWYLPDFRVKTPQGEDIWYEIKPRGVDADTKFDRFKAARACEDGRAELLSGDPVDVVERAEICPRCGFLYIPRTYKLSCIYDILTRDRSWQEYSISCYPCDAETPSGGGNDLEPGFLGILSRPHKGVIMTGNRHWLGLLAKRVRPAALKARQARFEHGKCP